MDTGVEDINGFQSISDADARDALIDFNAGIAARWNNRFKVCCEGMTATNGSRITKDQNARRRLGEIAPVIYSDCCCRLAFEIVPDSNSPVTIGVFENKLNQKSTIHNWNRSDFDGQKNSAGNVAGHEFGHFLGNVEDYGVSSDPELAQRGSDIAYNVKAPVEGEGPSVMGDNYASDGVAQERHLWRVLDAINKSAMSKCLIKPAD